MPAFGQSVLNIVPVSYTHLDVYKRQLETVASDSDGQVLFEADLPCGYYYVEELCPASGYLQNPERYHFDASYTGQDGEEVLVFRQEVRNTQTSVSVSKRDLTNGEELEGSELAVIEKMCIRDRDCVLKKTVISIQIWRFLLTMGNTQSIMKKNQLSMNSRRGFPGEAVFSLQHSIPIT